MHTKTHVVSLIVKCCVLRFVSVLLNALTCCVPVILLAVSRAYIILPICLVRSLQYLYDHTWFDVHTQALFVEFTVYNANVNLFCIVTLMLETTAIGK